MWYPFSVAVVLIVVSSGHSRGDDPITLDNFIISCESVKGPDGSDTALMVAINYSGPKAVSVRNWSICSNVGMSITAGLKANRVRRRFFCGPVGGFVTLEPHGRLAEFVDLRREFQNLPVGEHLITLKWRIVVLGATGDEINLGDAQTTVGIRVIDKAPQPANSASERRQEGRSDKK